MEQLILHGIGDYIIQTSKWALNKKKSGLYGVWCCFIHCFTYSLPFLFIGSPLAVLAIFATHYILDRTNIVSWLISKRDNNGNWQENFGFPSERPQFISIWLNIITDNLLHIICNYLALRYL